jgi:hypothetical protein
MTTQTDYRCDEWNLILGAPGLIALVIIKAEQCSSTAVYKKLRAVMAAIEETSAQGAESALIQAVVDAVQAGQSPLWPTEYPQDLDDVGAWALEMCRQVPALLRQRASEAEAEAYGQRLMRIARRVALAPADGGHADDGLARWDGRQRAALEALAATLGVTLTADAMSAS